MRALHSTPPPPPLSPRPAEALVKHGWVARGGTDHPPTWAVLIGPVQFQWWATFLSLGSRPQILKGASVGLKRAARRKLQMADLWWIGSSRLPGDPDRAASLEEEPHPEDASSRSWWKTRHFHVKSQLPPGNVRLACAIFHIYTHVHALGYRF